MRTQKRISQKTAKIKIEVIILNRLIKITVSVLLCAAIALCPLTSAFAASVSYPQGVTQQSAANSVKGTDLLIKNALAATRNTTLEKLVMPALYSDETLSSILTGIYTSLGKDESVSIIGIDVTPAAVAAGLSDYPQVQTAVSSADTWENVKLDAVSWGVQSTDGFAKALSAMFSTLDDVLYMLLCGGTYQAGIIRLRGDKGYENGIIPMLRALGCTEIMNGADFEKAAAEDNNSMIYNIVLSVCSMLRAVLASPADKLTDILPNLAYYIKYGGLQSSVDALMSPLSLGIGKYISLFSGSQMLSLLMFIQDSEKYTTNFSENINTIIAEAAEPEGLQFAEIDLELLASCGTENGGVVTADKGQAYVTVFRWLIETARLNKEKLLASLDAESAQGSPAPQNEQSGQFDIKKIAESVFTHSTDEILAFLIGLFTEKPGEEAEYNWPEVKLTPGAVAYTQNLGAEKFQRVVDGIDETIGEFVAEGGEYKDLSDMLRHEIYSSKTVTAIVSGIFSAFDSEEMKLAAGALGVAASPVQLALQLPGGQFEAASKTLSKYLKWEYVKPEAVYWGFNAGDRDGFENALAAALSPLEDELRMLLCCGQGELFGSVKLSGSNGYNTAVIPLLEAVGCPADSILTYEQFKADTSENAAVRNLLRPISALIDRVVQRPIYTLTEILPNLLFFIQNGSATQCVSNLIAPVMKLVEPFGITKESLGLDVLSKVDYVALLSDIIVDFGAESNIKLAAPDFASLATLGQLEEVPSKRTFEGKPCTAYYVKADKPAVMITLLRYIVGIIKTPENSGLLDQLMAPQPGAENDMFAMYSQNIGSEMEKMTADETIEWLYKLFFRERAVSQKVENKDYLPNIIYVPKDNSKGTKTAAGILLPLLAAAAAVCIIKREAIFDYLEDRRQKKLKEKAEKELSANQEV